MTCDTFYPLLLYFPKNCPLMPTMKMSVTLKVRTQPTVGCTDATTLRARDSSTWVRSPSLQAWYFWSRSCSHFSSKLWIPLWMVILQALWSVARVSHPKVGMLHSPRDAFRPSLNLFNGHVTFCTPVASSEKKTTVTRCVIHPNHMSNPLRLFFHDEYLNAWQVGSLQHFCVWGSTFPGDAHILAKAVEVKLVKCFQLLAALSHSLRAGKWRQLPYAL